MAAPSTISKNWPHFQSEYTLRFNGPPAYVSAATSNDSDRLPLPQLKPHSVVYFLGFANFVDKMKTAACTNAEFLKLSSRLIHTMSKCYANESARQTALREVLEFKFPFSEYTSSLASKKAIKSDLSLTHHDVVIVNIELKNDFGEGGKNLNYQQAGYYLHFSLKTLDTAKLKHDLAPMVLISIVSCSYLQAFAAYRNETNEVCMDPISQPLSLMYDPSNQLESINIVACFLEGMYHLIDDLKSYYDNVFSHRSSATVGCCQVSAGWPYFNSVNNETLTYLKRIKDSVFLASLSGKQVIVKFVRGSYGIDVHRFLAERGLAPSVIHVKSLQCSWEVVVMNYIESNNSNVVELTKDVRQDGAERILDALAERNYVHGDLRRPNLIYNVSKKTIMVIDFDWAGTAEQVSYPHDMNTCQIEWPSGAHTGQKILKEHDRKMIYQQLDL